MKHRLSTIFTTVLYSSLANNALFSNTVFAEDNTLSTVTVIGDSNDLKRMTGAAQSIDAEALEQKEYDNIHRILNSVPGVTARGEDGYGLRPNIGIRGTTTERSKKITLLEDGVLIAPAPYSAPAAYYFPLVSRMHTVEVVKGPAAIKFGPNTVGGAINMISRPIPYDQAYGIDLSLGSDGYEKKHGYYGWANEEFGLLLEGIQVQSDGFKTLNGQNNTGFKKKNAVAKFRYSPLESQYKQQWDIKLGYADETSNETYLGLSDTDFEATPYARYPTTALANMQWTHRQYQLSHLIELNSKLSLNTTIYRNEFDRVWTKLNSFWDVDNTPSFGQTLTNPTQYQSYYDVLAGKTNSNGSTGLALGTNDRSYYSQGIQFTLDYQYTLFDLDHTLKFGIRVHNDEVARDEHESFAHYDTNTQSLYNSETALLPSSITPTLRNTCHGDPEQTSYQCKTVQNLDEADAASIYAHNTTKLGDLTLAYGLRMEYVQYKRFDYIEQASTINEEAVFLPGIGAHYQVNEQWGLLAGIHKGYTPKGPGQAQGVLFEESIGYEFGTRYNQGTRNFEAIGFFTDYQNLLGSCTASNGCSRTNIQSFNGGKAEIYGLESSYSFGYELNNGAYLPAQLTYTHTKASFKETFTSDFALWGDVRSGDAIPYLPEHKLNANLGYEYNQYRLSTDISYTSKQQEQAGLNTSNAHFEGFEVPSMTIVDLSAHYQINDEQSLYVKVDNILDKDTLIARRPFGARPTKPRTFIIGYKYIF